MKVSNLTSDKGNKVANQFEIEHEGVRYFQSYNVIVAKIEFIASSTIVTLDSVYWDYSKTTKKYLVKFLWPIVVNFKEVRKYVNEGFFKLDCLNNFPF